MQLSRTLPASRASSRAAVASRPPARARRCVVRALVTSGTVTDKTWKSVVVESPIPVVVDFWAPWCGPCKMIMPMFDELAAEYEGRVTCVKLNTDESPDIASELGVRSIPTIMVFKGGERLETIIGAVSKSALVSTIEKCLAPGK